MQVRVLWLYFMEGRTQAEIADELSTNRLRINRIISEARRTGLVTITLNSRLTSCVELERQLSDAFGLNRAIIVPTPKDVDLVPVLLGQATAEYVNQLLSGTKIGGIGVGWGATLREMVRHMPSLRRPELCVNSVMGGLTRGIEINTFDIASDLARQLSAECAYLAAPIYAGSQESRDAIMTQDVFREAFERIAANDMIIISAGDLTERSLLMRYGMPKDVDIDGLARAGAQGDLLAQFINRSGKPIDHPINRRAIALPLDALRAVPNVVLSSGGMNKAPAIAAALRSGLCDVLVCDEDTARAAASLAAQWREEDA
ncbi:sugar-binding transcriptional regulator [Aquamicrobium sp. LC103]|uniref:sugar-binding transcriptional regulator n=1 Tax=Aquamicrobium sp. LC103 TaxID=1120658 RepID=UPI000AD0552C|nr:sugar-binding transcriptional regulator [Aquamicrobium sp. LC103]